MKKEREKYFNLQLTSPYRKCPYKCPYCVSNFEGEYMYRDLYHTDPEEYFNSLKKVLSTNTYTGVVLTGMTDPTLFPEWVRDVLVFVKTHFPHITTTLQTASLTYVPMEGIDVIAYSIGSYFKSSQARRRVEVVKGDYILRYNLMLSKQFRSHEMFIFIKSILKKAPEAQFTVKYLQPTSNGDEETDKWIRENRLTLSTASRNLLEGLGAWIDESCLDNEERYHVFREDGKLYGNWSKEEWSE